MNHYRSMAGPSINNYRSMAGPPISFHQGELSGETKGHQYHGQYPLHQGYPVVPQNHWQQYGYGYNHNRKPLTCGPCNRTFYSQQRMDEHVKEHVECPFPECKLSAHIKVIDQHINNQHMLINFEALQIDDETWINERKKRFPTSQRAELRRAQQMEKLKRGERLGVNKKLFNKEKRNKEYKRGSNGKQIRKKDSKSENIQGEICNKNEIGKEKICHVKDTQEEIKTNFRNSVRGKKNFFGDHADIKRSSFDDRWDRKRLKQEPTPKPSIDVDLYESDEEILGVLPFKGTRHFYESTGEVNYFSLNNFNTNLSEKEFIISDDEEWEKEEKDEGKMVLGGALGSLMVSYSDSEEDEEVKTAPETSAGTKNLPTTVEQSSDSAQVEQISDSKNTSKKLLEQSTKEKNSRNVSKRKPRTHNRKGKKPLNIHIKPKRRKHLLERLLQADIIHERNVILQCVRFIVENNFFDKKDEENRNTEELGQSNSEMCDSFKEKIIDNVSIAGSSELSNKDLSEDQFIV